MGYLYETHMHTSQVSACAVVSAAEQVRAYKNKGYAGIIVTDHFINGNSTCPQRLPWKEKMKHIASGYVKAKAEGDKCGLDVFFGWEFTIRGSDFLTYGLDLRFLIENTNLDRMDIEEYSALVRRSGGYLAQAHPYRVEYYIERQLPVDHRLLDGIEVYNSSMPCQTNEKAFAFARRYNLPMQSGTDSHGARNLFPSGVELGKKATSIFDIIDAVKANKARLALPW